ncbi:hypothetical protein [Streptomyces sp. NPDC052127]|uniref:hypothetical protein n=1 Tax=Streptomyces sp. NPDC052127 TaxID=3155679 RepID=UPI0034374B74
MPGIHQVPDTGTPEFSALRPAFAGSASPRRGQDQDRRDGRLEADTALTDVLEKNGINQLPVEVTLA